MNKKLVAFLSVALIAMTGTAVFVASGLWTSASLTMSAQADGPVSGLGIYSNPACTLPFPTYAFPSPGLADGQTYTVDIFVKNVGNQAVFLTYSTTPSLNTLNKLIFDNGQTSFTIAASVQAFGDPGNLVNLGAPVFLVQKDPLNCAIGYSLANGKAVRITVSLTVNSIYNGGPGWSWTFNIDGCS